MKNLMKYLCPKGSGIVFSLSMLAFLLVAATPLANNTSELTDEEKIGLVYSLEEAKMSYELAEVFSGLYPVSSIKDVGQSEEGFIRKIRDLIRDNDGRDTYGLIPKGLFNIQDCQNRYNQYVQQGKNGVVASLFVMATVEELVIEQMENRLAQTSNERLFALYTQRMDRAKNGLRNLVLDLGKLHVKYEPQILPTAQYQLIVPVENKTKEVMQ
jgi:hypothetical protein